MHSNNLRAGGTCWEESPDEEKADAALPGKAVMPEGVTFTQVGACVSAGAAVSQ